MRPVSHQPRRAAPSEAPAIARLFRLVRRISLPYLPDLHTPEEDLAFFSGPVFERSSVWVVDGAGGIIGLCAHRPDWVDHLYVHPNRHHRGIGRALIGQAKAEHLRLQLWVFQRNLPAIAFYEAEGFTLLRSTDGSGNEEKEPDALYGWQR